MDTIQVNEAYEMQEEILVLGLRAKWGSEDFADFFEHSDAPALNCSMFRS